MLTIMKPTREESLACTLVAACIQQAIRQATRMTAAAPALIFTVILRQSAPKDMDGPAAVRIGEKAAELLADLERIAAAAH